MSEFWNRCISRADELARRIVAVSYVFHDIAAVIMLLGFIPHICRIIVGKAKYEDLVDSGPADAGEMMKQLSSLFYG